MNMALITIEWKCTGAKPLDEDNTEGVVGARQEHCSAVQDGNTKGRWHDAVVRSKQCEDSITKGRRKDVE
jgi:hypothetical protein